MVQFCCCFLFQRREEACRRCVLFWPTLSRHCVFADHLKVAITVYRLMDPKEDFEMDFCYSVGIWTTVITVFALWH